MIRFGALVGLCSAAAFAAPATFTAVTSLVRPALQQTASCSIKGNVSIRTGEHIYHMPGQTDYLDTKISPRYGERWFCTEAEARAAGWRKAGN
jgi:hypothetical protein